MEFLIISGVSGSGKSTVINALEDIGFFCVDNIPPQLIPKFAQICNDSDKIKRAAFVTDIRGGELFLGLNDIINELKNCGGVVTSVKVMFLNASDEIIKRRYKETRRLHPLLDKNDGNLDKAIAAERSLLAPIAGIADYNIDTGLLPTSKLKETIVQLFLEHSSDSMIIKCMSFGFKFGIPGDVDLVFDVRFLPNPFYIPELKHKTGLYQEVRDFVMETDIARELEQKLISLTDFLIPNYISEGKSQLVIAFGCTGGKHRSVTFAERLNEYLSESGYIVNTFHRDLTTD